MIQGSGKLYRLDTNHSVHTILDGVTVSNGMGWSPTDDIFYYIDATMLSVDAFDFDVDSGSIFNRRSLITLSPEDGLPDGMCVDADGYLWVALSGSGEIRRYTSQGDLEGMARVPVSRVTSCGFGGEELADLYITSHSALMTADEHEAEPTSGGLFRCNPGVRGLAAHPFKG